MFTILACASLAKEYYMEDENFKKAELKKHKRTYFIWISCDIIMLHHSKWY